MHDITRISDSEILIRLAVAAALGAAVGLERELRERQAGLRTHLLVSVGSALFTLVSAYGFHEFIAAGGNVVRMDPTRIAAQIVSGIGFLGAGAIIRQGLSVRGLTTAATLWLVAAIGMASGAGYYVAAVIATAIAIVTLGPLRIVAFRFLQHLRPDSGRLIVQLPSGASPAPVIAVVEGLGGRVQTVQIGQDADRRLLEIDLELRREGLAPRLVSSVGEVEGVLEVRWED